MKIKDSHIFLLLLFLIIGLGWVIFELRTEGTACMQDPIVYGVKELEKANRDTVSCICTRGSGSGIIVTANNKTPIFSEGETYEPINVSYKYPNTK